MKTLEGFDFFTLKFDGDGKPESSSEVDELVRHVNDAAVTDVILLVHGFRNDTQQASGIYERFLSTFRAHIARPELKAALAGRTWAVAGIYWPSKPFRETFGEEENATRGVRSDAATLARIRARLRAMKKEGRPADRKKIDRAIKLLSTLRTNRKDQDAFVRLVLSLVREARPDVTEGVRTIRAKRGSQLLDRLAAPVGGDRDRGVLTSIVGRINFFLNLTTWYLMKERSAKVGAGGVAKAVRALKAARPSLKIHLVGHSLGGRTMAACAQALTKPPLQQVDSLILLEGAFSHYGFSPDNGDRTPGFFRDVVEKKVVRGPMLTTFSAEDKVVGMAYAIMSRLAGDNARAIGDAKDRFGGIGRNGSQKTPEATVARLGAPGTTYVFKPGTISDLDGSGGVIKYHSDVSNEAVTYAFATAVAQT